MSISLSMTRSAAVRVPQPLLHRYRGAGHVLVSRRSGAKALRARVEKLLRSGRDVHLHGLGAALAPTIALAAALVRESVGALVASTRTSTEMLVDRTAAEAGADEQAGVRYNSAVHVRLSRRS